MKINVGDRVAYSRIFLRSTGQYTGFAPFARGKVLDITELPGVTFVTIKWDSADAPGVVNLANLVREDQIHLEAR